jgi:hypothetical protein
LAAPSAVLFVTRIATRTSRNDHGLLRVRVTTPLLSITSIESGREDSNLRPLGPEPSALSQAELRPVHSNYLSGNTFRKQPLAHSTCSSPPKVTEKDCRGLVSTEKSPTTSEPRYDTKTLRYSLISDESTLLTGGVQQKRGSGTVRGPAEDMRPTKQKKPSRQLALTVRRRKCGAALEGLSRVSSRADACSSSYRRSEHAGRTASTAQQTSKTGRFVVARRLVAAWCRRRAQQGLSALPSGS